MTGLTIVIPAFNSVQTIEAAVRAAGSCRPDELIVVDDGSSDPTGDVAARLGARVIRQKNTGAAAARRAGFTAATSEFVVFVDSDDVLIPQGVAASLERSRSEPCPTIVTGAVIGFDKQHNEVPYRTWPNGISTLRLLKEGYSPVQPGAVLWPREVLDAVFGSLPQGVWPPFAEDYELLLRGSLLAKIESHGVPTLGYRMTGGKSTNVPTKSFECADAIRLHYAQLLGLRATPLSRRQIEGRAMLRQAKGEAAHRLSRSWVSLILGAARREPLMLWRLIIHGVVGRVRDRMTTWNMLRGRRG